MAYWKCKSATIKDDGRLLELSFYDEHSCETRTTQLPAEDWKEHLTYRFEYERGDRRIREAVEEACRMAMSLCLPKQEPSK